MINRFFLFLLFLIFQLSSAQAVSFLSFNQTQTINITGIASTIDQATIDSYLNVNGDGLTWDVLESDVTPAPSWPLTFTTQQVESLSLTPLTSDKFIVAWCDEVSKSINFKIYSTKGEVLVDTVTVDSSAGVTNACDYNSVSVSALNSTHFAIVWFDAGEQDVTFAVYDDRGTLVLGPLDEDTAVGTNSWGVSISAFNSTHIVIGYYDYADQDATFSTWSLVTITRVAGPIDVDAGVSTDCYNVHVAALNSTHFVFFYYDAGPTDDATFAVYTITGTAVKAATDEDAAIGNSYSLSLTALNSSYFVLAYYDAADRDITFSIYNSAGTRVVGPIDEDTEVGTGAWVSVAALNSTHFVISYYDAADGQHTFSIYNWNTRVVGPIDVSTTTLKWVSVTSFLASLNIGICNRNWIFAEVFSTSNSRFFEYTSSGNQWNGYCLPIYQLSIEHNATVSYIGTLRNISILINFTSTNSKSFNISIYDFVNSNWVECQNIYALPNIYYDVWCNITSNLNNFISSDGKIRVRLNTTKSENQTKLKEEFVQFYLFYAFGYLEVRLVSPSVSTKNYIIQKQTFWLNASVICRNGDCGIVNGTALYNLTSIYPDTPINTSYGDKPFFINESQPSSTKSCGELLENQICYLSWLVNASGDVSTEWKVGVEFSSNFSFIARNATENATIYISPCPIDFELTWNSIDFGILNPSTQANPAPGNSELLYNITVKPGSCNLDFYIRGEDLYNPNTGSYLKISNVSVSNSTNSYYSSLRILNSYQLLFFNLTQGNYTTYYWIDVPPIYAGAYTSKIYILGVLSGNSP